MVGAAVTALDVASRRMNDRASFETIDSERYETRNFRVKGSA
jgi:hypothetical protein